MRPLGGHCQMKRDAPLWDACIPLNSAQPRQGVFALPGWHRLRWDTPLREGGRRRIGMRGEDHKGDNLTRPSKHKPEAKPGEKLSDIPILRTVIAQKDGGFEIGIRRYSGGDVDLASRV